MPTGAWRTSAYRRLDQRVDGVVGAAAKALGGLGVRTLGDLLTLFPRRYMVGAELTDLSRLAIGELVAVKARVQTAEVRGNGTSQRLQVVLTDGRATLPVTFFARRKGLIPYWQRQLQPGITGFFAGKVGEFQLRPQLSNPDYVLIAEDGTFYGASERNRTMASVVENPVIGIYPQTASLRFWDVAEAVQLGLHQISDLPDPLPEWVRERLHLSDLVTAFGQVHQPADLAAAEQGRRRLVVEEALAVQVTMATRRREAAARPATPRPRRDDALLAAFDTRLPFTLTDGQQAVSADILTDLAGTSPMQRLLQGEVGSGKTIVALRAMLAVVDAGGQAALLAPTEVLAAQHHETILRLLGDLGAGGTLAAAEHATSVRLLTGSMPTQRRREVLLDLASGQAGIAIGTHALLADTVQFADLGLVVVDEQHRFGVEQRAALGDRAGTRPHLLVMTATPIPRSVAMTAFGDLEVSTLTEIPAGRSEVSTVVVDEVQSPHWLDRAWQRIVEEVAAGRQAFVVVPRIGDSDSDEVGGDPDARESRTIDSMLATLADPLAGVRIATLHGRLPGPEKEATMAAFAAGDIDVLVATTVVEVGVDVPNASVMVISDADRFGISQLHQLRGRIGRGSHPGVCLLLTTAEAMSPARERLEAVAGTRDGFALADVDLAQRREGDVLGRAQHGGASSLRLVRVLEHADDLVAARAVAEEWLDHAAAEDEDVLHDLRLRIMALADPDWLERA